MTDWQISESGATVAVDGHGRGTVTFTVTNPGADADRAVLRIEPLDDTDRDWFDVEEPQREVGAGDSVVWVVDLEVPEGTPAGDYAFQGVVYSADRDPGESSATSKRVTFEVAPSEEEGFPWWVVAVVLAVVVLIGGILWFLTRGEPPENIERPAVSGFTILGGEVEANPGQWEGADDFEFQWQRCEAQSSPPTLGPVPGETLGTLPQELELGSGTSSGVAEVAPTPGVAAQGAPVQLPEPELLFGCEDIPGEEGSTYRIGADDVGLRLRVIVTATNSAGSASATSPRSSEVTEAVVVGG